MSAISQIHAQEQPRGATSIAALRSLRQQTIGATYAATQGSVRQPDAVSISDAARSLAAARQTADPAADVREDRVSRIKAAIASGTYSVDSRSLATRLLELGAFDR